MNVKELESIVEAVLFAVGDAVSFEKLCEVTATDKKTMRFLLKDMADRFDFEMRGVKLVNLDGHYQLCSRPEARPYIQKLIAPRKSQGLSAAATEALAIIAYRQPVTRSMVEKIRGVNCDGAFYRLLKLDLITEKGRLDAPGRPILYGTTREFLRCFGLSALEELPDIEAFGAQAQMKLTERQEADAVSAERA